MTKQNKMVFLCYAHEDVDMVRKISTALKERGLEVWFDKENLKWGFWKKQVKKAILRSRYFVFCLSNNSLEKTSDENPGFVDEELQYAYDVAMQQSESSFSIVPVKLEDCDRGDSRLSSFQQYNLFKNFEYELDRLAIEMGGYALVNAAAKDEKTVDDTTLENIMGKVELAFYAKDFKRAIKSLDLIIEVLNPNYVLAYIYYANALEELGRYEEAVEKYQKATEFNPTFAEDYLNWGASLCKLGRFEEAIEKFQKAIEVNPNYSKAYYNWGLVLCRLIRNEEAIEKFQKAIEIDPEFSEAYSDWGAALCSLGRFEEAIKKFKKATKLKLEIDKTFYNWGVALVNLGHYKEAIGKFQKVHEINPNFSMPHYYYYYGIALDKAGRYKEAIGKFKNAIIINSEFVEAYYSWGVALGNLGNFKEAFEKFQKVHEMNPKFPNIYYFIYETSAMLGDHMKYDEIFNKGKNLNQYLQDTVE